MSNLNYDMLLEASKAGGPAALSSVSELAPAGGEQALVAPAKYTSGSKGTYVFERRLVDGESVSTVLIDSRTSEANRLEVALMQAIAEGQPTLSKMPKIVVSYPGGVTESDIELPHRAYDAHVRLGFDAEHPEYSIVNNPLYLAARNATPADAWGLLAVSPISILLGSWDSTRKSKQARFASCVTGEIIGVVSDQNGKPEDKITHRSGARIDPVGASIKFDKKTAEKIASRIERPITKDSVDSKTNTISGSAFVIGAIPPGTDAIDGISVSRIIRSRVLSFATLRSLCFGRGTEGDAAIRALLAAIAINAISRADSELLLRANAHLVEKGMPVTTLYKRFGEHVDLAPLPIDAADALLDEAYATAHTAAGIEWTGQTLEVIGEPAVIAGVDNSTDEE